MLKLAPGKEGQLPNLNLKLLFHVGFDDRLVGTRIIPRAVLWERWRADQESQQLSTLEFEAEQATRDFRASWPHCPYLVGSI